MSQKLHYWRLSVKKVAQLAEGTAPQDGRFRVRFPVGSLEIFKCPHPSVSVQQPWSPLSLWLKWVPKNILGGKVRPALRADSSAVLVGPNVKVKIEVQHFIPPLSLYDLLRGSFFMLIRLYIYIYIYLFKCVTKIKYCFSFVSCTLLDCTVLYCTVLYCTVLYCTTTLLLSSYLYCRFFMWPFCVKCLLPCASVWIISNCCWQQTRACLPLDCRQVRLPLLQAFRRHKVSITYSQLFECFIERYDEQWVSREGRAMEDLWRSLKHYLNIWGGRST
jgi:hypothetical protein